MSFSQLKSQTRCYGFWAFLRCFSFAPTSGGRENREAEKEKQFDKEKLEKFVLLNLVESTEHVDSDLLNFIGLRLLRTTMERKC